MPLLPLECLLFELSLKDLFVLLSVCSMKRNDVFGVDNSVVYRVLSKGQSGTGKLSWKMYVSPSLGCASTKLSQTALTMTMCGRSLLSKDVLKEDPGTGRKVAW